MLLRRRHSADRLQLVLMAALCLPLLLVLYAGLNDIVLFLDAAYYLYLNLIRQGFALLEPSSRTVQFLQQLPVVVLIWMKVENLAVLKVIAGTWNLLLPLVLTALTYLVLPQQTKQFFVFPLAAYVAGALVSFFPTITDAPAAAAYFWLLLCLVLCAERWRFGHWLTLMVAIPALFLHESMVFLGPILFTAALLRWRSARHSQWRWLCAFLMLWFLLVSVLAMQHIFEPRSVANRSGFLITLLGFKWYVWKAGSYNIAAVLSVYGLSLMFLFWMGWQLTTQTVQRQHAVVGLVMLSVFYMLFASVLLMLQMQGEISYSIFSQFAARAHATLVSFPLGIMLLLSWSRGSDGKLVYVRGIAVLLLVISVATCVSHAHGMQRWNAFLYAYAETLEQRQGYVSWQQAFASVPDMYELGSGWTNPLMSLFLADQGKVNSIIDNHDPQRRIQIFNPCTAEHLPRTKYFDFTAYQENLQVGVCRGQAQQFAAPSAAADFARIHFTGTRPAPALAASSGWQSVPESSRGQSGWRMQGTHARLELEQALPQQFDLLLRLAARGPVVGGQLIVRIGATKRQLVLTEGMQQVRMTLRLAAPAAAIEFDLPALISGADQPAPAAVAEQADGIILLELDIESASIDTDAETTRSAVPPGQLQGDHES